MKNVEIKKSAILEKAVMCPLIDNSSPSSEDKTAIFHNMVKKDDTVEARYGGQCWLGAT